MSEKVIKVTFADDMPKGLSFLRIGSHFFINKDYSLDRIRNQLKEVQRNGN
ncbi:hypothetical protein M3M35_00140 [Fructilactobacillus myrtifloralis]|uniref:Uncharacterized protein n=1 Tax=Fructilactobacillus myrtifloralis TaxID=2940301 RepID=A0ABY5BPH4_9LACO|nr:hypothetical protein [Fructilactobacillus myrtifloralis]USS85120.1 hypothetical protein M3M35_00140 [Fructilactobacillus myrtifloralis]